jgi:hypothetical protein
MKKVFEKIDNVIDNYSDSTDLQFEYEGKIIFTNFQIFNELLLYSEWSFLARLTDDQYNNSKDLTLSETFLKYYVFYVSAVGYNYYRMYDALTREYNPINNYDMTESSADGTKISTKNYENNSNDIMGKAHGKITSTDGAYEKTTTNTQNGNIKEIENPHESTNTTTQTGSVKTSKTGTENNDTYRNAFDSGISDTGTHTGKNVMTLSNRADTTTYSADGDTFTITTKDSLDSDITKTKQYNDLTSTTTEKNVNDIEHSEKQDRLTDDVYTTNYYVEGGVSSDTTNGKDFNEIETTKSSSANAEFYKNDVTISYNKAKADGTNETINGGVGYSSGTMHTLTRSGNIGVTTNSQLITGELEMRKVNLLHDFVSGFINKYCVYLGVD